MRRLKIKCSKTSLLSVERSSQWNRRMVYLLVANKSYKYDSERRSRIVYIGTTGNGAHRPATSAVDKASNAFAELRGVKKIEVHIATCPGRKSMKTWRHLESALLATFRGLHFELPPYNKKKGSVRHMEDIKLFRREALQKLILQFAD
jgi:hypothetical protein